MQLLKKLLKITRPVFLLLDLILFPIILISGLWFRYVKFIGPKHFYFTRNSFYLLGYFPIVKHYYEPEFDFRKYQSKPRTLPGINWNLEGQLELLESLNYADEMEGFPKNSDSKITKFHYENGSFSYGDADAYYGLIRKLKPRKIIEIGSGYSTLIALEAIKKNDDQPTEITCIEPYEMSWLENTSVNLIRKKVEDLPLTTFETLSEGDILFIDSSHVIRPGGDVLFEILKVLPKIHRGVWVHIHDIFTPFDYPDSWVKEEFRLWNEQYLVEAFLSHNQDFEIMLAINFLKHHHEGLLYKTFPSLKNNLKTNPGSLWLRKK